MKLAEFSVKNSLLVNMLSVFIILAGLFSLMNMQREAFPNVSFGVVQITTSYRGSTADQVEKFITSPIEKEIRGISGIDEIYSVSYDGSSAITIKLDPDYKDKDKVVDDVEAAVNRVSDLPQNVDRPIVYEIEMKEHPVIQLALSGEMPEPQLQKYAEGLEDQILDIDGVSKVERSGFRDKQIWVEVDPDKLRTYYVSMEEVMTALNRHNVALPGGKLRTATDEYNIRTSSEFFTPEEVEEVIIRANDAGNILKIKDIAVVRNDFEDEDIITRVNGTRTITLVVVKKERADAISVVYDLKELVKEFKASTGGKLHISFIHDMSYYIKRRLNVLKNNGIFGFVLVIAVLFLFLSPRAAAFTAIGLPIAFLATFTVMSYFGMSINLMTMFGLIMVLGLLVDDSIIISENVYRYVEEGLPPKQAAIKGASQVMLPVLATVLTTIAAFSPLMMMSGLIGKFVRLIPQVVIIALGASLLEAFIILPSHLGDFLKPITNKGFRSQEKKWFIFLRDKYKGLLNRALNFRYLVIGTSFIIFVVSIFLAVKFIPFMLFSGRGVEQFFIKAEAPLGTSLNMTSSMMEPVERLVETIPDHELDAYISQIGSIREERGYDPNAKMGSQYAQVTVFLTPARQRQRGAADIADSLRPKLKEMEKTAGFNKLHALAFKEGPPMGRAVEIRVRGDDFKILNKIAGELMDFLKTIPGVYDVSSSYGFGKLELRVNIDEDKAKRAGLTISSIAGTVRNAFDGGVATKVKRPKADKEIEVLVRFPEEKRNNLDSFKRLLVPNLNGKLIPLEKVVTLEKAKGVSDIRHLDGKRTVTVTAEVDAKKITPIKVAQLLNKKFKDVPSKHLGYILKFGGEQKETRDSLISLLKAFALAFFLIFIILTTQFRSLVQPFVVMLAIPLGIIGVIVAFLIHKEPFSFMAILGLIGLGGVVVNDSIVLMDFVNKLRADGVPRRESITQAGALRLRPVLLTTITTVFGLMPVAYGIGGFDPFVSPAALAISWGLLFGTLLTLIVLPCTYAIIDDIALKLFHHSSIISSNNNSRDD